MVHIKKKPRQPVQCKYCDHICRSDNLKKHLKKHAAEIKLIENYKTIIDSLKEQHTEQIEDLKEQHTEQIEELKLEIQELQEEIQEIKEEKEEEVNALKKENDKLQKENDHLTYTFENMTLADEEGEGIGLSANGPMDANNMEQGSDTEREWSMNPARESVINPKKN